MPVIPGLRKLRLENCEFEGSLGSRVRPCLQKQYIIKGKQTKKEIEVAM
jgi:hypothetical protein